MTFSFVLLTWNRFKFLEKCLAALIPSISDPSNAEIIVMNNGSTDATADVLGRYGDNKLVKVVSRNKNYGLNAYKKLFDMAQGEYVVVVDDDVLEFPSRLDQVFKDYMRTFSDYGFIALNVVQDEFTNGAKPGPEHYKTETRDGKTIEYGPTGGWCACFRKRDYHKLRLRMKFANLNMRRSEDGYLVENLERRLALKSGIIRDEICFHACGPHYAKVYGHLSREIEKYAQSGLSDFVRQYSQYAE